MTEPQPYDFARPPRLTAEAEQRVSAWLRAAAALAAKKAARHLPFALEMTFTGLVVDRPAEALARLPEASVGFGAALGSEAVTAMAVLPRDLALLVVGGMLGDTGAALPEDRALTAVEDELGQFFVQDALLAPLQETWPAAQAVPLKLRRREPHPRWTRIFSPEDNTAVCSFAVKGPFGDSAWYWLMSDKQLREQLARSAPGASRARPAPSGLPERERLRLLVEELPVDVTVVLGTVQLTLAELAQLYVGDVVILNQRVSEPLPAYVAGAKKGRGWPGRVGSRQAFEIESLQGD
jgi:flagellar motor switch protein FliM